MSRLLFISALLIIQSFFIFVDEVWGQAGRPGSGSVPVEYPAGSEKEGICPINTFQVTPDPSDNSKVTVVSGDVSTSGLRRWAYVEMIGATDQEVREYRIDPNRGVAAGPNRSVNDEFHLLQSKYVFNFWVEGYTNISGLDTVIGPCHVIVDASGDSVVVDTTSISTPAVASFANLPDFISSVILLALGGAGVAAFFLIGLGAYKFMTSAGNPEGLQSAQDMITSAVAGLVLIVLAVTILGIMGDIIGLGNVIQVGGGGITIMGFD